MNTGWPLPNVWLGVSTERQKEADERIPFLLQTPASIRFISAEPLVGPIDISRYITSWEGRGGLLEYLDWVIVGGESGPNARPMHPDWARSLRDQCAAAGVSFFFKQWGEFAPVPLLDNEVLLSDKMGFGGQCFPFQQFEDLAMVRFGKKRAGRTLDGKTFNEFPQTREIAFA